MGGIIVGKGQHIGKEKFRTGIITALPEEHAAVNVLLDNVKDYTEPRKRAMRRYRLGEVPSTNDHKHHVVLSLACKGTNSSAIAAALLLERFQNVKSIIMVGIAGGVPNPDKPDEHVRLGDVVVSDEKGVIQYDFVKEGIAEIKPDHPPRPPSASLLEAVKLLESAEMSGNRPWLKHIDYAMRQLRVSRPPEEADILVSSAPPHERILHPHDSNRIQGQPRVFIGPIASANRVLRNPIKRDELRDKYGVKAVEMEGSGIADATWDHEAGYLVVRGICDYCDPNKGNEWHKYAAIVAAAYTRSLLESIPYS